MRPSLTRRLLTLHVATTLLIIGLAACLIWVMMRRALYVGLDETLYNEATALAGRLEVDRGRIEFEEGSSDLAGGKHADAVVQIVDEQHAVVFTSRGLRDHRSLIDYLPAGADPKSPSWFTAPIVSAAEMFRAVALHVRVTPENDEPVRASAATPVGVWVCVARPIAAVEQTLGQLASILAMAVGTALLAAIVGGLFAAKHGTRPVRSLAENVSRVDPHDPELALDHRRVPIELEPIVRTTERLLERIRGELTRQRQLTADVAHDLRTPVAGVRALLEVCLQRDRTREEYVAAIQDCLSALRQLSRLLDDVLTLSRLDAGIDRPIEKPCQLEDLVEAAVATVQPLAAAREVAIHREPHSSIPLRTDGGMLTKVLANLLSNAVAHSPHGRAIRITVQNGDGAVEVSIADQGPGIPPEMRGRIFERFVRGDASRQSGDEHHGLGLPIAAGLARMLGGEVVLDESYGPGCRFVARLKNQLGS